MKQYSKRILSLIRTDVIMMNGGKNGLKAAFLIASGVIAAITLFLVPLMAAYGALFLGILIVSMMTRNEIKFHGTKTFSIIPIERKDLVLSRYIFIVGTYIAVSVFFYLLMLTAWKLELYGDETAKLLKMMTQVSGDSFSELSLFSLFYVICFTFGLAMTIGMLHRYFKIKDYEKSNKLTFDKKLLKRDALYLALIIAGLVIFAAIMTGVIPLGGVLLFLMQFFLQLLQAAGGLLFTFMCLIVSVFMIIYSYVSSLADYETRDL